MQNTIEKIVSLCKRRGFIFQSSDIYGGFSAVYDYGPLGIELKNNISQYPPKQSPSSLAIVLHSHMCAFSIVNDDSCLVIPQILKIHHALK